MPYPFDTLTGAGLARFQFFKPGLLQVYTDGAIRPERGLSGLAAIVLDGQGRIHHWWSQQAGALTCNEAEYAAIIMAMERLRRYRPKQVTVYSDSQLVVHQMQGLATAQSPQLRLAHARLRALTAQFEQVTFQHIPRDRNRLADALANEAADGRCWGSIGQDR